MAEARSRDAWNRASCLMALLANIHRDPKKSRAFKPADFNPHVQARRQPIPLAGGLASLKGAFIKGASDGKSSDHK